MDNKPIIAFFSAIGVGVAGCLLLARRPRYLLDLPINEGEGDYVYDHSGHNNYGLLGGGVEANKPTWLKDQYGPALSFEGTQYIDCGKDEILGFTNQDFSILLSLKPSAVDRWQDIFTRGRGNLGGYELRIHPHGRFAFRTHQPPYGLQETGSSAIQAGKEYRVILTRKGPVVVFYLNGVKSTGVPAQHIDPAPLPDESALIGNNYYGLLRGHVKVRLGALTGDEAMADYLKWLEGR